MSLKCLSNETYKTLFINGFCLKDLYNIEQFILKNEIFLLHKNTSFIILFIKLS